MRWFRFYADAMRDPKVARLSDAEFRLWMECLCVASENDGLIPAEGDLKHILKRRLDHLSRGLKALIRAGLMDVLEVGYKPHGWDKRQYKSDSSTDRSRKHREKCNVAATPPDTDTEQSIPLSKDNGQPPDPDKQFWDSAKGYLGDDKGSLIGKLCKQYGRGAVVECLTSAMLAHPQPPDRTAFLIGILKRGARNRESGLTMPC